MKPNTDSVEERIIKATIDCIEQFGIQGASNRKIAKAAGVNSAAINYYFRTKDALISRCMQVALEDTFPFTASGDLAGGSAKERCAAILDAFIQTACRLPGVTRALFFDMLTKGSTPSLVTNRLNQFMLQLVQDLQNKGPILDIEELHLATAQISAAVLWMALAPCIFEASLGLDMHDPDTRQVFINRLVEKLF